MLKLFSSPKNFYPSLLLHQVVIFLVGKGISPFEIVNTFFLSSLILILIILLAENLITTIYKFPQDEVRLNLFLLLFLSPVIQLNLFFSFNIYLGIFFLLFAFLNYLYFNNELKKTYLLFTFLSLIFSIYFCPYSFAAALPLLIIIILRSGWKSVVYFIISSVLIYFLVTNDFLKLSEWNINNYFSSGYESHNYETVNITFVFFPLIHPFIFIAGILVLPFIRKPDFEESIIKILIISFLTYSLYIAGLPFQHFSKLLISFSIFAILIIPALFRVIHLSEYFKPRLLNFLPYLIYIIQLSILVFLIILNESLYFN